MSLIKKLDDISGTTERSKNLSEAINKVADAMEELKSGKSSAKKTEKKDREHEEK